MVPAGSRMQRLEVQSEPRVQLMAWRPHRGLAAERSPGSAKGGAENKAKRGWSSLQLLLCCSPPMMGSTSCFQQWVMLGYPALGVTGDTAEQKGLAPAAQP